MNTPHAFLTHVGHLSMLRDGTGNGYVLEVTRTGEQVGPVHPSAKAASDYAIAHIARLYAKRSKAAKK